MYKRQQLRYAPHEVDQDKLLHLVEVAEVFNALGFESVEEVEKQLDTLEEELGEQYRNVSWLEDRIAELEERVLTLEDELECFKRV